MTLHSWSLKIALLALTFLGTHESHALDGDAPAQAPKIPKTVTKNIMLEVTLAFESGSPEARDGQAQLQLRNTGTGECWYGATARRIGMKIVATDSAGKLVPPTNAARKIAGDVGTLFPRLPRTLQPGESETIPLRLLDYFPLRKGRPYRVEIEWQIWVFPSMEDMGRAADGTGKIITVKSTPVTILL